MELGAAGLKEQPFRTHGRPIVFVAYEGQERATDFLKETCIHNSGLALFQGPSLSGKTTILEHFADEHREHCSVALISGANVTTTELIGKILRQYGYEYPFDTFNELLGMLKVFMRQQTATSVAPMLIVEDTHKMGADTLRVLCELAEIRVREKFALKIVLASDRPINYLLRAPAMECLAKRLTGDFHLEPMSMDETNDYLHAKMSHAGCLDPDNLIPESVCDEFYAASGGWPGLVERLGLLALAKATAPPLNLANIEPPAVPRPTGSIGSADEQKSSRVEYPILYLTHNGKTLDKIKFKGSRLLIGRSTHNDVSIDSKFISRHHTLLVRNGKSTLLMDLNSANGTYVNSWRVSNQVLLHNDVITIGEHGLKFVHVAARNRAAFEGDSFNDTVMMQSMADMRRVLAREHTEIVPNPEAPTDQPPDTR